MPTGLTITKIENKYYIRCKDFCMDDFKHGDIWYEDDTIMIRGFKKIKIPFSLYIRGTQNNIIYGKAIEEGFPFDGVGCWSPYKIIFMSGKKEILKYHLDKLLLLEL